MKLCRICLECKKKLCSVFESEQGITYADMLESVAQVKIMGDVYKNNICLQCRKKLRRLYDFKKQIERSDLEIRRQQKILKFDNIHELKVDLIQELRDDGDTVKNNLDKIASDSLFKNGCNTVLYKNTTIKKFISNNIIEKKIQGLPVLNFLSELKCENTIDYEHDSVLYYEDVENFETKISKENSKYSRLQRKQENCGIGTNRKNVDKCLPKIKKVCIKPVVLDNIRIIPSRCKHYKKRKQHIVQKQNKRKDMCPHCGVMSTNIKSHIMVHIGEKKYKCSECNKAFFTSKLLNYHQRKHVMAGTFKCDHCVAVFDTKGSLQSHMVIHTDDKKHVCLVCNKGFKRRSALLRHKVIHNSSAKSIKCELCNMSFFYKQGLRHHMRVHTGERPFKCEICSQPYSYKHDFNRHCLKKHGVYLKRRSVYVMNEEVLIQERALMKDLMLRAQGVVKEGEPLNPFQGPQAALAFEQAVKALGNCQIPMDVVL